MEDIVVRAPAKLNLTLDVLGRREDGYHDLRMVMQSITLADTLTLRRQEGEEVRARTSLSFLPGGEKNLAVKAALCFYRALGRPARGMEILLDKRIPVCAGMGGGSSDAVAFLLPDMDKESLFPTVIHDGALPRKTFSMGRAQDKRFYLEARRIRD